MYGGRRDGQGLHAGTVGTRGTGMLQFQGPAAIAVDDSCIYVADGDNHRWAHYLIRFHDMSSLTGQ